MTAMVVTALILAFCYWALNTLSDIVIAQRKADRALRADSLALKRDRLKLARDEYEDRVALRKPAKRPEPMPTDLLARINAWEDDWAKEDERNALNALYAETGDWELVRRQMGPSVAENSDLRIA